MKSLFYLAMLHRCVSDRSSTDQENHIKACRLTHRQLTDMATLLTSGDINNSTLEKPCISCRKRKVKCSKTRPCSNCSRTKQLCLYDGDEPEPGAARQSIEKNLSSDEEVRERLARLEKLMETMIMRESRETAITSSPNIPSGASVAAVKDTLSHVTYQSSLPPNSPSQSSYAKVNPHIERQSAIVGQILFQEHYSGYFDSDFWAGMVSGVRPQQISSSTVQV